MCPAYSVQEALSLSAIRKSRGGAGASGVDLRSSAEVEREQNAAQSVATSTQVAVMQAVAMDVSESAKAALESYVSGSCHTVELTLTADPEIEGEEKKEQRASEIRGLLSETEPKWLLLKHRGKKVFAYYCPHRAEAKVRFSYLVHTANVLAQCAATGIAFDAKVEMTALDDVSEEYLDSHVLPAKPEKSRKFKGPNRPKRRRKYKSKKRDKIDLDGLCQ